MPYATSLLFFNEQAQTRTAPWLAFLVSSVAFLAMFQSIDGSDLFRWTEGLVPLSGESERSEEPSEDRVPFIDVPQEPSSLGIPSWELPGNGVSPIGREKKIVTELSGLKNEVEKVQERDEKKTETVTTPTLDSKELAQRWLEKRAACKSDPLGQELYELCGDMYIKAQAYIPSANREQVQKTFSLQSEHVDRAVAVMMNYLLRKEPDKSYMKSSFTRQITLLKSGRKTSWDKLFAGRCAAFEQMQISRAIADLLSVGVDGNRVEMNVFLALCIEGKKFHPTCNKIILEIDENGRIAALSVKAMEEQRLPDLNLTKGFISHLYDGDIIDDNSF